MRILKKYQQLIYCLLFFGLLGVSSLEARCHCNRRHVMVRKIIALLGIQQDFDLQGAINAAQSGDTIQIPPGIIRPNGRPINAFQINKNITLIGTLRDGEIATILSGNGFSRVLLIQGQDQDNIINVTLKNLIIRDGFTISDGQSPNGGNGAGILNTFAKLKLENVKVINNRATANGDRLDPSANGGGIANIDGSFEIFNCEISNNIALATGSIRVLTFGGGISTSGSLADASGIVPSKIVNSIISSNQAGGGGGISNTLGKLIIKNCQIDGNTGARGGGLFNGHKATLILKNSLIRNNIANRGGGIFNDNDARLKNCIVEENVAVRGGGGGIFTTEDGTTDIDNRTIIRNNMPPP